MLETTNGLIVGKVLDEPVSEEAGDAVRDAFLLTGQCPCGIAYIPPSRRMRRNQWRTGDVIEHTYRHADTCAGGEHTVLDLTYRKEGN